jgi:hypothetical protein
LKLTGLLALIVNVCNADRAGGAQMFSSSGRRRSIFAGNPYLLALASSCRASACRALAAVSASSGIGALGLGVADPEACMANASAWA